MPVALSTINETDDSARGDDRDHAQCGDRRCGGSEFAVSRKFSCRRRYYRRAAFDFIVSVAPSLAGALLAMRRKNAIPFSPASEQSRRRTVAICLRVPALS